MRFLRRFWDAAIAVDPAAAQFDEGVTMRYCTPDELRRLFEGAGLGNVRTSSAVTHATYRDLDDLWQPIVAGIGPSGVYAQSLDAHHRQLLRGEYAKLLGVGDGPFQLSARAWLASGDVV
jgi:hypothetical protein